MSSLTAPITWIVFRLFCLLMLLTQGAVAAYFGCMLVDPQWADSSIAPDSELEGLTRFFSLMFVVVFGIPLLPMVPALVWPRSRSGWYLGLVTLIGGIFTMWGWPMAIPLLAFWCRDEVSLYAGFSPKQKLPPAPKKPL